MAAATTAVAADLPAPLLGRIRTAIERAERDGAAMPIEGMRSFVFMEAGIARAAIGDREAARRDLERALREARSIPVPSLRATIFGGIGAGLARAGDRDGAGRAFGAAYEAARGITAPSERCVQLATIAADQAESGGLGLARLEMAEAGRVARSIPPPARPGRPARWRAIQALIVQQLRAGFADDALRTAAETGVFAADPLGLTEAIEPQRVRIKPADRRRLLDWARDHADEAGDAGKVVLSWVAINLADLGDFDAALATTRAVDDGDGPALDRVLLAWTLAGIAEHRALTGDRAAALALLDERVRPLSERVGEPGLRPRSQLLLAVARARARAGDLEGAAAVVDSFGPPPADEPPGAGVVVLRLPGPAADPNAPLRASYEIARARAMTYLAAGQVAAGRAEAARRGLSRAFEIVKDAFDEAPVEARRAMQEIAEIRAEAGAVEDATAAAIYVGHSTEMGAYVPGLIRPEQIAALCAVARARAQQNDIEGARRAADLAPKAVRPMVLSTIAQDLARHGAPFQAVRLADSIDEATHRAGTLDLVVREIERLEAAAKRPKGRPKP
jgi:tetratricopeptide (TPR) repeat protein